MTTANSQTIVVTGATGLQGGAVTRHLLKEGWSVRGLTRNAAGNQAQALKALGAEVVQGDMEDVASLRPVFAGAYGVYSVQNPFTSGAEAEVRQGKNVADVAKEMGVQHLVYASAGVGRKGTNIPSWETKLQIEDSMKALALPLTILRPMAFMELMTHKKFFPAAATWHIMPTLIGSSRPVPWLCTDDLGAIAAKAFAAPHEFVGQELTLASDVQSLDECRSIYREVMGKNPSRFPMPIWLFKRFGFVGTDLTTMWHWLRTASIDLDVDRTHALHPDALSVRDWLQKQKSSPAGTA
ncbi:MAG: NmrA/HSCARG family protein [Ardenticatenaceae bacterium]|nr:NmrA/HSCARG family protein [Ardenticatenaceae bacterium]